MKEITMTTRAQTLDSMPTDKPERMVVAGPVLVEVTISFTGGLRVAVKYDVSGLKATASPTPIAVRIARRISSAYNQANSAAKMTVLALETSYERNMASSALWARRNLIGNFSQIGTVKVPSMDESTPIARMIRNAYLGFA